MVSIKILHHSVEGLTTILGKNSGAYFFCQENLSCSYFNITGYTACTSAWLVDHDTPIGLNIATSSFTGRKQDAAHRSSKSGTDCGYRTLNFFHNIINRETGSNITSRTVDIEFHFFLAHRV